VLQSQAQRNPMFLNLLSWPSETYREDFYASEHYHVIQQILYAAGVPRIFRLEPMGN